MHRTRLHGSWQKLAVGFFSRCLRVPVCVCKVVQDCPDTRVSAGCIGCATGQLRSTYCSLHGHLKCTGSGLRRHSVLVTFCSASWFKFCLQVQVASPFQDPRWCPVLSPSFSSKHASPIGASHNLAFARLSIFASSMTSNLIGTNIQ